MITATQALEQIKQHAIEYADDRTRYITPVIGQYIPQGDINLLVISEVPSIAVSAPPNCQLAPGTSRGSRHCIAGSDMGKVEFFALPNPNPLEGPILKFNGEVRIQHPEHGDHIYPAGTILAVGYQRRYAEELRRIQD